jgi:hypothetical protein
MDGGLKKHMENHIKLIMESAGLAQECAMEAISHDTLKVTVYKSQSLDAAGKAITNIPGTMENMRHDYTINNAPFITELCERAS